MRPITPQTIVETLRLGRCNMQLSPQMIQKALMVSENRSREILRQMEEMGFMIKNVDYYQPSKLGTHFLDAAIKKDLRKAHQILLSFSPYSVAYQRIRKGSASVGELSSHPRINRVAVDMALRFIGWTHENLVKNPHTERYYLTSEAKPCEHEFFEVLCETYRELSSPSFFGMRKRYVKISKVRERVCERLGITKQVFDELLCKTALKRSDDIELAGAPTIGVREKPLTLNSSPQPYYYLRMEVQG